MNRRSHWSRWGALAALVLATSACAPAVVQPTPPPAPTPHEWYLSHVHTAFGEVAIKPSECYKRDGDQDAITDCNDQCPYSPSGSVVGLNGCPADFSSERGARQVDLNLSALHFKFDFPKKGDPRLLNALAPPLAPDLALIKSTVDELDRDPTLTVRLVGYTDSIGTKAYNLDLSDRRADAVRRYLVQRGISDDRITTEGFGKSHPVASNKTAAGRAENRRVEVHTDSDMP